MQNCVDGAQRAVVEEKGGAELCSVLVFVSLFVFVFVSLMCTMQCIQMFQFNVQNCVDGALRAHWLRRRVGLSYAAKHFAF